MTYEHILTDTRGDGAHRTGLITLNRPKQLNALNNALMDELGAALLAFDADDGIGCIVVTGSEKAFAAGADISAMAKLEYREVVLNGFITRNWETLLRVRKPVIAAVAGFALGGGCELAMMLRWWGSPIDGGSWGLVPGRSPLRDGNPRALTTRVGWKGPVGSGRAIMVSPRVSPIPTVGNACSCDALSWFRRGPTCGGFPCAWITRVAFC
jgi:hypothetical protein